VSLYTLNTLIKVHTHHKHIKAYNRHALFHLVHKLNKLKHGKSQVKITTKGKNMAEAYQKEIVQRIIKNLLDIQLLRLVDAQPLWGYKIKKQVEAEFNIKLRHGALYPMLNRLERQGFLASRQQRQGGRTRKVYTVTKKGKEYLQSYYSVLKEQLESKDHK
jgi:DNA-binding PadR family transcriptional regulator